MDGLKQGVLAQCITKSPFTKGQFQIEGTASMAVDEVSCIVIATGQEFRSLGRWSWILLQVKNNIRTRIVTAYYPAVRTSARVEYSQQLEAL